jgi:phosphoglycolate phosphatase
VNGALVVGFDLDMTLIDPRPGIRASFDALIAETGIKIDIDVVLARLGPPLEIELANWVDDAERIPELAAGYRAHYLVLGVPGCALLPGARDAITAVRDHGGRTIVVTAKEERNARACIDRVGLTIDAVAGLRYGDGKAEALREHGATIYVGDTVTDIASGRAAAVLTVGVATGPDSPPALRAAGADVVLDSLTAFPAWLAAH